MLKRTQHLIAISLILILTVACDASTTAILTPTWTVMVVAETKPHATETPRPSATPTTSALPTLAPTVTSWPSATPLPISKLITHTWEAGPVLVQYYGGPGDGGMLLDRGVPTILYTDGTFITGQLSDNHMEIMQGKFSRKEVCALLNTLDQTGFLNLTSQNWDQNTYRAQYEGVMTIEGAPSTIIEVNAWLTQTVSFYELGILLNALKDQSDAVKDRYVPKVIRDTDSLLSHFEPHTLTHFIPNRLALVVTSYGQRTYAKDYPKWPLSLQLGELISPTLENVDQIIPRAIGIAPVLWTQS